MREQAHSLQKNLPTRGPEGGGGPRVSENAALWVRRAEGREGVTQPADEGGRAGRAAEKRLGENVRIMGTHTHAGGNTRKPTTDQIESLQVVTLLFLLLGLCRGLHGRDQTWRPSGRTGRRRAHRHAFHAAAPVASATDAATPDCAAAEAQPDIHIGWPRENHERMRSEEKHPVAI